MLAVSERCLHKPALDSFGVEGADVAGEDFCRFPFWLGCTNYSIMPKMTVAFSMNFSAEAITALAPD